MLNKTALDVWASQGCSNPGCNHKHSHGPMYFHSRCHPPAGVDVSYTQNSGSLLIECAECKKQVAVVKVSDE